MQWIPKGGRPLKVLRRYDAIFRSLADTYGLSNMRTAREGEAVIPPPPEGRTAGTWSPSPGVELPIALGACTAVDAKQVAPLVGSMTPERQPRLPHISERTIIDARYTRDGRET